MRKMLLVSAALSLALSWVAAGEVVIGATVYTTQHEYYADVIKGMRQAADKAGAKLIVTDANGSATTQNNQIEDFTIQKVNAIITYGVDPQAIVPSVEEAIAKGIPVITADMQLQSDKVATFIGSDNVDLGVQAGKYAKAYIEKEMGGKAKMGVITWLASIAQQERLKGFRSIIDTLPGVEIVAIQDGDGREKAMVSAENILQANPNLDMFYGTNEGTVLGALSAVESDGKIGKVKLIGIDISQDAGRAIKAGNLLAVVAQQPVVLGEYSVNAALEVIGGKKLDKRIVVPVKLVDKSNVAEFGF